MVESACVWGSKQNLDYTYNIFKDFLFLKRKGILGIRGGTGRAPYLFSQRCFCLLSKIYSHSGHDRRLSSEVDTARQAARTRQEKLFDIRWDVASTGRSQRLKASVTSNGHQVNAEKCGTLSDALYCKIFMLTFYYYINASWINAIVRCNQVFTCT